MRLRKDGKPDGRTGSVMARTPKPSHPWTRSWDSGLTAREKAEKSGFVNKHI